MTEPLLTDELAQQLLDTLPAFYITPLNKAVQALDRALDQMLRGEDSHEAEAEALDLMESFATSTDTRLENIEFLVGYIFGNRPAR